MNKLIEKLRSNLSLKLVSLIFAFLIWTFVLSETNPVRDKAFENVSVTVTGEQTLAENGLVIIGNWTDKIKNLRIDTEILRNDYFRVTADDFKVTLDLSSIQTPDYELPPGRLAEAKRDNPQQAIRLYHHAGSRPGKSRARVPVQHPRSKGGLRRR